MTYLEHVSTEILADHAEGLLGESDSGRVEAHLAECDDCRATALLLASIPEILAADEVGPMPAVYASRIDAAIADLLVNEPPVPVGAPVAPTTPVAVSPIGHDMATNNVIDLASRRKVALAGLRRVGTVAAGVVLLIAGAALGIQTVGKDKDIVGPTGTFEAAPSIQPSARTIATMPTAPKTATKGRNGSMVDPKTGTVFTKDGKVLYSDGTVVLPPTKKGERPTVLTPGRKTQATSQPAEETKTDDRPSKTDGLSTARGSKTPPPTRDNPDDSRKTTETAPPEDPAALGAQDPNTDDGKPSIAAKKVSPGDQPSEDPYVSESRSAYTEDNFAALVMDLVAAARRHSAGSSSYEPSSTGTPSPSPTPSAKMPAGFKVPAAWASFFKQSQVPQQPGRGPSQARYQERVKRCAQQLGELAIAGDIGTWRNREATIVVVNSSNPDQVDGYVFYGNCPKDRPVSAESAQWTQRVDRPAPDAGDPVPTPAGRTGSVQPAGANSTSRHYGR